MGILPIFSNRSQELSHPDIFSGPGPVTWSEYTGIISQEKVGAFCGTTINTVTGQNAHHYMRSS